MGHRSGVKYSFKLNEEHENYEKILVAMQEEIAQKYKEEKKDPGESFGASMGNENGSLKYSSSSYKSRISNDLSGSLIGLIEKNINSNPDMYYYIKYNNGEDAGAIDYLYGYAKKVGKHLYYAGYSNHDGEIYKSNAINKFHECMNNPKVLEDVMRQGEIQRFKEYFKDKTYNAHVVHKTKFEPNNCFYKNHAPDEKWLAYFLAYDTDTKLRARINPVHDGYVNLKEMLYINDNDLNGGKWGVNLLQYLMEHGVAFKEGLESVEANFYKYGRNGYPSQKATKEEIEQWYQANKVQFKTVPVFSEETITLLQENFPGTLEKLQLKLEQLKESEPAVKSKYKLTFPPKRKL